MFVMKNSIFHIIMKKLSTKNILIAAVLSCMTLLGIGSCTQSTTPIDASGSNVAIRTEADIAIIHSSHATEKTSEAGVDSLQVISAAYAASNFMLRSDISDDQTDPSLNEAAIRPPQFLLAFDASGRQYIGESIVSAGTYKRARFTIHPLQGRADSLALALGPLYSSLFSAAPANSTIVIKGFVWKSGVQMPFTYTSSMTGNGTVQFEHPLVVGFGSPMEVLVRFSSQIAFTDGTGAILDPRDGRNAAAIEENLKTALKAFVNNPGN